MSERREDAIEFPAAAETGRVCSEADPLTMAQPARPRIVATLERCPREASSRHGLGPGRRGGRSLPPVAVSRLSRTNARIGEEGRARGPGAAFEPVRPGSGERKGKTT